MPIGIDEFDDIDETERHVTNAERILQFLVRNRDRAFTAAEIADATDVAANSVNPVLYRLEERELVRHKEPYWAVGDLDRVRDSYLFGSTAAFLDEELGAESREAWLDAATDESTEDDT